MSLRDVLLRQSDTVRAITARYGATNLRLFGSAIRGDERPDNDIDLLVDLAENRGFRDYLTLVEELESLLGRRVEVPKTVSIKSRTRSSGKGVSVINRQKKMAPSSAKAAISGSMRCGKSPAAIPREISSMVGLRAAA